MSAVELAQPTLPGLEVAGLEFGPTGVLITGPYDPAAVVDTLKQLRTVGAVWRWIVGDLVWALAADGDLPTALRQLIGIDVDDQPSLARTITVAQAIPLARRRADLTWSHHYEVAGLPAAEQDRLLATAAAEGLSVRGLRAVIDQEHEDLNPRLPGIVWQPKWPSPRAVRALLDEVGESGWILVQPSTGEMHAAPAHLISKAS